MFVKSPLASVPPLPEVNVHDFLFTLPGRPPVKDFTRHINGLTGERISRNEFLERVRDGATALISPELADGLQIAPGEMVGIFSHNALDYITLVHSLLYITTPFALLSAYATVYELAHSLRISQTTRLFIQPDLLQTAIQAAREVGLPEERIYILEGDVRGMKSFGSMIDTVRKIGLPKAPVRPVNRNTLAYLVFSSGTTGLPKAVMVSHRNICYTIVQNEIFEKEQGHPVSDSPGVVLAFLPIYHTYGLHMSCFRGFLVPVTSVVIPKWDINLALELIPKYNINLLLMIPSAIHQLVHFKNLDRKRLASVTAIHSGAAYLPPKLGHRLKEMVNDTAELSEGYGMSELTIGATRMPTPHMFGGRIPPILGSAGILLPGMEARIVREDGSDANVDEPGELWLRGENVAMGYWKNEEATKKTFLEDGWLRTGDQMRVDKLGRFYFMDRAKDTLKVSGIQVSPTEIEDVLIAHPNTLVSDACVAGVSGGRTSDEKVPRAWVVLSADGRKRGIDQALHDLDSWVKTNLSKYKWLRGGIEAVDEIPKSPTGKVLRRVLQDIFEQKLSGETKAKL